MDFIHGKSKSEFDSHMNIHFEFNCPHCDYTSRTEGRLKRHIKDFHSDDSSRRSMPGRPKVYKCKQCQFSTTEKDKFWEHARTHIKEDKLLQCPNCPFVTEYKHHLEYHLRNHFNSKPFKCNKCNYSCVNKSMLNSHMKSHTNVYQYRCSNCTYATKYCHSLKLHLRKYNHKPATVLNQDGSLPQGLDAESSGLSIVAKRGPPRGPRCQKKDKNDPYLGQLFGMPPMGINTMLHGMMPFWPMLSHVGLPGHPSPQAGLLPNLGDFTRQNQLPIDDEDSSCHVIGNGDNSSDSNASQLKDEEILPVPVGNKETPLDLTKPKSVSPTTFSNPNSPQKLDSDHEDNQELDRSPRRSPEPDSRKRPFENQIPSAPTQETSSRKRSRKGKAYKLDTFCLKLQEKQSGSNILDSDEQDSDMEINFERFQPLQSALKDKVVEEEETCFKRLDSVEEITTEERSDYKKDDDDDYTDKERSDAEDTDEYEVKNDETEMISQFKEKQDEIKYEEKLTEEKTENDSDEESDFEKLQRVLNIINNEPEDSKIKPVEVDKIQKEEPAEVQSSEVKPCEKNNPESNTDESKTEENKTETQLPMSISKGQGEAVDQVDMINTVLQNRKKPLPPAIRRGTELAWKLLHDPVNPVTSLPLPVDSPPIPIQSEPVKPSTSLSMPSVITSTVQPNRNVLKHAQPLPYPQRPYPTPHPSQVMMNPPLPLPIPPTPMAFIPPTSHLMPEVPMARPSPKMAKMAKPEEYSCTYCGLYFQDCVMYTVHMGYHSNQNPFKCNSCGIVCRDKVEFFLHIARSPHS